MLKNLLLCFPIIAFCGIICFAQQSATRNDFFGYYVIQKSPKNFADIDMIHLAGNYAEQKTPSFYGLIRLKKKSAKDFRILKPTVDGKSISFSTVAVSGINYHFAGAFTKMENFPETRPDGEILLKGTLQKFRGKTKIAEAKLNFIYTGGD